MYGTSQIAPSLLLVFALSFPINHDAFQQYKICTGQHFHMSNFGCPQRAGSNTHLSAVQLPGSKTERAYHQQILQAQIYQRNSKSQKVITSNFDKHPIIDAVVFLDESENGHQTRHRPTTATLQKFRVFGRTFKSKFSQVSEISKKTVTAVTSVVDEITAHSEKISHAIMNKVNDTELKREEQMAMIQDVTKGKVDEAVRRIREVQSGAMNAAAKRKGELLGSVESAIDTNKQQIMKVVTMACDSMDKTKRNIDEVVRVTKEAQYDVLNEAAKGMMGKTLVSLENVEDTHKQQTMKVDTMDYATADETMRNVSKAARVNKEQNSRGFVESAINNKQKRQVAKVDAMVSDNTVFVTKKDVDAYVTRTSEVQCEGSNEEGKGKETILGSVESVTDNTEKRCVMKVNTMANDKAAGTTTRSSLHFAFKGKEPIGTEGSTTNNTTKRLTRVTGNLETHRSKQTKVNELVTKLDEIIADSKNTGEEKVFKAQSDLSNRKNEQRLSSLQDLLSQLNKDMVDDLNKLPKINMEIKTDKKDEKLDGVIDTTKQTIDDSMAVTKLDMLLSTTEEMFPRIFPGTIASITDSTRNHMTNILKNVKINPSITNENAWTKKKNVQAGTKTKRVLVETTDVTASKKNVIKEILVPVSRILPMRIETGKAKKTGQPIFPNTMLQFAWKEKEHEQIQPTAEASKEKVHFPFKGNEAYNKFNHNLEVLATIWTNTTASWYHTTKGKEPQGDVLDRIFNAGELLTKTTNSATEIPSSEEEDEQTNVMTKLWSKPSFLSEIRWTNVRGRCVGDHSRAW